MIHTLVQKWTLCLGHNGVHEAAAWRIALSQLDASSTVKAKMLDFRSTIHHRIDCATFKMSADGHAVAPMEPNNTAPLWNTFHHAACPGFITNAWFAKKTKKDILNLLNLGAKQGEDPDEDAHVTVHDNDTFEATRVKVSDVCSYVWDPDHDWSPSELNWEQPKPYPGPEGAKFANGNVMEFGHLHEKKI